MRLIPAPGDGSSQVLDERPRDERRQCRSGDYPSLRVVSLDGFKIDPADKPDELFTDLDVDAFAENAGNDLGLRQDRDFYILRQSILRVASKTFFAIGILLALAALISGDQLASGLFLIVAAEMFGAAAFFVRPG